MKDLKMNFNSGLGKVIIVSIRGGIFTSSRESHPTKHLKLIDSTSSLKIISFNFVQYAKASFSILRMGVPSNSLTET